ncbi:4'-phosphopantetheinyl transferase family protein [Mucilaginibacter sp. UYCu711]|uniref:4'-phosphopantetheinyl transferase family protein n=1 Tax=Mucilaginibacter sp. UYCu711 TaxID=3156339 RepID=UPI003D1F2A9A
MTTVLYANISDISDAEVQQQAKKLPNFMLKDISRFKQASTQKLKIIARLMLLRCLENSGQGRLINKWEIDDHQKPQIIGWFPFNISHSGDIAVLAYGTESVGVDIERIVERKYELIEYFHPLEQYYINSSKNKSDAFFEIWAKKEAFLKALGVGLGYIGELNDFNCLNDTIAYQGIYWFFLELPIDLKYKSYLCVLRKEFTLKNFFK